MKKITSILILIFIVQLSFGQRNISLAKAINGIWGEFRSSNLKLNGTYNNLIIYSPNNHPSNYILNLKTIGINRLFSSSKANKEFRKNHLKQDKWFEVDGTVYFYGAKDFKSFLNIIDSFTQNSFYGATETPNNGSSAKVKVRIAPFKDKHGIRDINIIYENSGLGISLN